MPLELKFDLFGFWISSIIYIEFLWRCPSSIVLSNWCFPFFFSKASKMMPLELKTKLIKGFEFLLFGNYCICFERSFLFLIYWNKKKCWFFRVPINSWSLHFLGNSITTVAFQPDLMTVLTMIYIITPQEKNQKWISCQTGILLNTCPRKSRYLLCNNCGMFKGLLYWPTNIMILFGQY